MTININEVNHYHTMTYLTIGCGAIALRCATFGLTRRNQNMFGYAICTLIMICGLTSITCGIALFSTERILEPDTVTGKLKLIQADRVALSSHGILNESGILAICFGIVLLVCVLLQILYVTLYPQQGVMIWTAHIVYMLCWIGLGVCGAMINNKLSSLDKERLYYTIPSTFFIALECIVVFELIRTKSADNWYNLQNVTSPLMIVGLFLLNAGVSKVKSFEDVTILWYESRNGRNTKVLDSSNTKVV
jgi:hypothetical protein